MSLRNLSPDQFPPSTGGVTMNHPIAGPVHIGRQAEGNLGVQPKGGSVLTATYHPDFASQYGGVKGLEDYTGMHEEEFIGHVDHHISRLTKYGPWKADEDD